MAEIRELVHEAVESTGCELVQLRELPKRLIQAMVDKPPQGVNVDDLSTLTRAINAAFERDGRDPGNYTIEVVSPGIDRPLVRDGDFTRFAGEQVHVKLREKRSMDGRRNYKGTLVGLEDGRVVVKNPDDKNPWRFLRGEIREVRLIPNLPKVSDSGRNKRTRKPRKRRRKGPKDH